jgi:hypothetical protein
MSWALFRKELREHGWVMLATYCLSGVLYFAALSNAQGGGLAGLAKWALQALPLCAFVAANRLIAREYAGRTQLFLETLPVSRARVFTTKVVAGLGWVLLPALLACAYATTRTAEHLEPRHVTIVTVRIVVFALAFYCFAVFAAALGRFRWVTWLTVAMLVMVVTNNGWRKFQALPVVALVDQTLAFERLRFPVLELAIAGVIAAASFALAMALIAVGQGALAAALARRMTAREKVYSAVALLSVFVVAAVAEDLKQRPRFALKEGVRAHSDRVEVAVSTGEGVDLARATTLAQLLAGDAEALAADLALKGLPPPVFALPHAGLDADLYVLASLGKKDGVVVQAAFARPGFDAHAFRAFVLRQLLASLTRRQSGLPDRAWFADGFSLWWTARRTGEDVSRLEQRALAAGLALPPTALDTWGATRERLGPCLAEALAYAAVRRLEEALGAEVVLRLARESLGREGWPLLEGLGARRLGPRLEAAGAPSTAALAAALASASDGEAGRPDGLFSRLGRHQATVEAVGSPGQQRLEQRFEVGPGTTGAQWRVLVRQLGPWEREVGQLTARRFDLDARAPAVLPVTLVPGALLFAAVEVDEPALGCAVRPFQRRWEVP